MDHFYLRARARKAVQLFSLIATPFLVHAQDTGAASTPSGPPVSTPTALRADISVSHVMDVGPQAVRLLKNPVSGDYWYTTFEGDVFKIVNFDTKDARSEKMFSAQDHGITRLQGAAFLDNTIFLCGNISVNEGKGTKGRMVHYDLAPNRPVMSEVFNTVEYGTNATTFDHGWNALEISPDKKYIYVNTGARTDHGEVQDNKGAYPNARDNALTARVFRFPVESRNLLLKDDENELNALGFIYASGIRNAYDMAFDGQDQLFGVINSGDYDHPEDMFWIREGRHYGFPWIMGGVENPQQYPGWVPHPDTDSFMSKFSHAWIVKYFHDDPNFPKIPEGVRFSPGVQNMGPDANEYRDIVSGRVTDGDLSGVTISTFNAHSSPLGLIFDTKEELTDEFKGDGFVIRHTGGGRAGATSALRKEGKDLLHLKMTYSPAADNYYVQTTRIVDNFNAPTDAVLDGNHIYIIEYNARGNGRIWKITLPE